MDIFPKKSDEKKPGRQNNILFSSLKQPTLDSTTITISPNIQKKKRGSTLFPQKLSLLDEIEKSRDDKNDGIAHKNSLKNSNLKYEKKISGEKRKKMVKKKVLVQKKKKDAPGGGKIKVVGKVSAKLSALIQKLQSSSTSERKPTPNEFAADKVVFAPRIKAAVEKINIKEEQLRNWRLGSVYRKKRLTLTGDNIDTFNRDNMEFNNDEDEYEIEEIEEEEAVNDDGDDLQADVDELLETYATSRRRRTTRRVRSKKGNLEKFMNEHKRKPINIPDIKDDNQNLGAEINDKESEGSSSRRTRKASHNDDFDLNREQNKVGYGNKVANRARFIKIIDYDDFRFKIYVSTDYKSKSNGQKNEEEMKKYAPCKEIDITLYATYEREKNEPQGKLIKGKIYSTLLKSNRNTFKKYKGMDYKKYRSYVNKINDMVMTNKSNNYTIKKKNNTLRKYRKKHGEVILEEDEDVEENANNNNNSNNSRGKSKEKKPGDKKTVSFKETVRNNDSSFDSDSKENYSNTDGNLSSLNNTFHNDRDESINEEGYYQNYNNFKNAFRDYLKGDKDEEI